MLNPMRRTTTRADVQRYKVEPYVVAADVYSEAPHAGRGGWTWYTGSAGWLYRAGLEWILGFRVRENRLTLAPCVPPDWPGFTHPLPTSRHTLRNHRRPTTRSARAAAARDRRRGAEGRTQHGRPGRRRRAAHRARDVARGYSSQRISLPHGVVEQRREAHPGEIRREQPGGEPADARERDDRRDDERQQHQDIGERQRAAMPGEEQPRPQRVAARAAARTGPAHRARAQSRAPARPARRPRAMAIYKSVQTGPNTPAGGAQAGWSSVA